MGDLRSVIGLGVAGNFAGHLEQAGEASDFVGVKVADSVAPKGLFPFYVPGAGEHFLAVFPISSREIRVPAAADHLQIEPEVALICDLRYRAARVAEIVPREFAAHNDCSIRREGARKISEKKNWGACSKGCSEARIAIDHFGPGGILDHFRIASYLERGGELHAYGVNSAVTSYSYFHDELLDWIRDRMNDQEEAGPLESIARWLKIAGHPERALISIGATRYTDFGERNFLEPGDRSIVVVYDARRHDEASLRGLVEQDGTPLVDGASFLCQRVLG